MTVQVVGASRGIRSHLPPQWVKDDDNGNHSGDNDNPADNDSGNDAIHNRLVTLNVVCYPGGPQRSPAHLWQKERQADVKQLSHGFPRSRVTDGSFHADTYDGCQGTYYNC